MACPHYNDGRKGTTSQVERPEAGCFVPSLAAAVPATALLCFGDRHCRTRAEAVATERVDSIETQHCVPRWARWVLGTQQHHNVAVELHRRLQLARCPVGPTGASVTTSTLVFNPNRGTG